MLDRDDLLLEYKKIIKQVTFDQFTKEVQEAIRLVGEATFVYCVDSSSQVKPPKN